MSLCPTTDTAMVLLTSGIVDEQPMARLASSVLHPTGCVEPGATSTTNALTHC